MSEYQWLTVSEDDPRLLQLVAKPLPPAVVYLLAISNQGESVAAGSLRLLQPGEAIVEVLVEPAYRQRGLGRECTERLITLADNYPLLRLTAHGTKAFWLELGFCQVLRDEFSRLLPAAVAELEQTWHQDIPITDFMGLTISHYQPGAVETRADLAANINVHQTMFAGSIYSQAVLTGWGLVHLALKNSGFSGSIVLADGSIRYRKPIAESPRGWVKSTLPATRFASLSLGKRVHVELEVDIFSGQETTPGAIFNGRYVILPSEAK